MDEKQIEIEKLVIEMLEDSIEKIHKSIPKAIKSGALDIDGWNPKVNPMVLPKIILMAVLESEAGQYKGSGTSFEKQIRKEVNNLKMFIV